MLRREVVLVGILLALALLARELLTFTLNANWDEYNFLRFIYENLDHGVTEEFQTFHVHLFGWVTHIDGLEVDQIIAGRQAMFIAQLLAAIALWRLGFVLLSSSLAGLFAALATSSFTFVIQSGASFRYDPLLSALFLLSACLILNSAQPPKTTSSTTTTSATTSSGYASVALAGAALALALVLSLKAVFFAPSLLAFTILADPRRASVIRVTLFLTAVVLVFAALHLWHRATLNPVQPDTAAWASHTARAMFDVDFFPRLSQTKTSFRYDFVLWILLIAGAVITVRAVVFDRAQRRVSLLILALGAPMITILIYRNAWPYFFVSVFPGASLFCAATLCALRRWLGRWPLLTTLSTAALSLVVFAGSARFYAANHEEQNAPPRAVLAAVHQVFPTPVTYLDRCGMVSSFPKVGPFMSTLTMELQSAAGASPIRDVVATRPPVFIVANHGALQLDKAWAPSDVRLSQTDFSVLQQNYIHHWGPLWVAGKSLARPGDFDIAVAGTYTVESNAVAVVDDVIVQPGDVVALARGPHRWRGNAPVTLRWGAHLTVPAEPEPSARLFVGFHFR